MICMVSLPAGNNTSSSTQEDGMSTLGFKVKADLEWPKTKEKMKLTTQLRNVNFSIANGVLIPMLEMVFHINTANTNKFLEPYHVKLIITELNMKDEQRTVAQGEFASLTNSFGLIDREPGQATRPDDIIVTQKYVLKDAYSFCNTCIGGVFEQQTMEQMIQVLWNQTEHGKMTLKLGKFDNKIKYEDYWVPDLSFTNALRMLSQYGGFYNTLPIIYSDFQNLYITSLNEIKDKPITLYLRTSNSKTQINADNLKYGVHHYPTFSSVANMLAAKLPLNLEIITYPDDTLYKVEELDFVEHIQQMKTFTTTDLIKNHFDKDVKTNNMIVAPNPNLHNIKEVLSQLAVNTVKPSMVHIADSFRFPHWTIGRKVKLDTTHRMYSSLDLNFYIQKLNFKLSQKENHRWDGTIDVSLNTVSTKHIRS